MGTTLLNTAIFNKLYAGPIFIGPDLPHNSRPIFGQYRNDARKEVNTLLQDLLRVLNNLFEKLGGNGQGDPGGSRGYIHGDPGGLRGDDNGSSAGCDHNGYRRSDPGFPAKSGFGRNGYESALNGLEKLVDRLRNIHDALSEIYGRPDSRTAEGAGGSCRCEEGAGMEKPKSVQEVAETLRELTNRLQELNCSPDNTETRSSELNGMRSMLAELRSELMALLANQAHRNSSKNPGTGDMDVRRDDKCAGEAEGKVLENTEPSMPVDDNASGGSGDNIPDANTAIAFASSSARATVSMTDGQAEVSADAESVAGLGVFGKKRIPE